MVVSNEYYSETVVTIKPIFITNVNNDWIANPHLHPHPNPLARGMILDGVNYPISIADIFGREVQKISRPEPINLHAGSYIVIDHNDLVKNLIIIP
jgi:hypothetical protein